MRRAAILLPSVALISTFAGCHHDWDTYLPVATGGGGASSSTSALPSSSSNGGAGVTSSTVSVGGFGGVPGTCPVSSVPALVKVFAAGASDCVDSTEVTNADYAAWLATTPDPGSQEPQCTWNTTFTPALDWPPSDPEMMLPVRGVDWCDAVAYCVFAGKRLCGKIGGGTSPFDAFTDAGVSEWFNACSEVGSKQYPYGGSFDGTACNGVEYEAGAPIVAGSATACVGGFQGLHDMSGNVWEWEDSCDGFQGATDKCRVRGGAFNNARENLSCDVDSSATRDFTAANVGFRCCASAVDGNQ